MSEHLRNYPEIGWIITGFFIFFILFITFVVSTFLPTQKRIHHRAQYLPLDDQQGASR